MYKQRFVGDQALRETAQIFPVNNTAASFLAIEDAKLHDDRGHVTFILCDAPYILQFSVTEIISSTGEIVLQLL